MKSNFGANMIVENCHTYNYYSALIMSISENYYFFMITVIFEF